MTQESGVVAHERDSEFRVNTAVCEQMKLVGERRIVQNPEAADAAVGDA